MRANSYTKELIGFLEARTNNGNTAFEICAAHEANLIAALHRRFGISQFEAELFVADIMRSLETTLYPATCDHLSLDDAIDAVEQVFGDD